MKKETIINKILFVAALVFVLLAFNAATASQAYGLACNNGTEIEDPVLNLPSNVPVTDEEKKEIRNNACSDFGGYSNSPEICTDSNGEWVVGSEVVAGHVIDASFCKCPEGKNLIDGRCTERTVNRDLYDHSMGQCESQPLRADESCLILKYSVDLINILSAVAGMAIVGSIMIAGYQYMTARDNPGQIEAAKKRIVWALVALGLFIFMYAILDFLIPGGVL